MTDTTTAVAPAGPPPQITAGGTLAALVPQNLDDAFRLSKALSLSGDMVPKHFQGKPEMIMAAVIRGMEIGLAPMQALANIAVINGRASLWGDALPALMQRAGHHIDVEMEGEGDKQEAVATLTRGDTGKIIVRRFSVADAKKAQLWNKPGPWQQYPQRMLANRARSWAVRDGAADALMGLQIAEEVSDYAKDVTPKPAAAETNPLLARKLAAARGEVLPPEPEDVSQDPADHIEDAQEVGHETGNWHWTQDVDTTDAFPGADEFSDGAKAFKAGKARRDCPEALTDQQRIDWLGGFDKAQEAVR
jgi:ribosome modulation factor